MRTESHGRPPRLVGHDYATPGAYFVTLATYRRQPLFGTIERDGVRHSAFGRIAADEWLRTGVLRPDVLLDSFVVMPDHVHGVLVLTNRDGAIPLPDAPASRLPRIIGGFKAAVTRRIRASGIACDRVWQSNYFERVIRDWEEMARIRRYIANNPLRAVLRRDARPQGGPTAT